jgi:mlo protein
VGISAYLWAFVVIFLLLNVHGWYTYFWIAFIPFILILLVGTKLQQIITDLALEVRASVKPVEMPLEEVNSTIIKNLDGPQGQELVCNHVRPRDDLFWFSRPQLVLYLIHFILFQNAFELAYFFWLLKTFGITSCIMGKAWVVIVRLVIGVFVQVLCSYSTLPLYALVTQMGSHIKLSIFQESTELAIHGWREKAKERQKKRKLNHHSESSPIRKIFGPSSRSQYHNSQLQHSVKLSQGESHTTPSVPSGDVDRHQEHTEDIRAQERPSDGSHTVEIVEQPSAATAQGEQQPAPAHVTSGIATSSIPQSVHAVNQLLMAKRSRSQEDTN